MDKRPLSLALLAVPVLGLALLATLVLACRDGQQYEDYSGTPSALSVEDVFARAAEAMTRPGYVLHVVSELDSDAGPFSGEGTAETWIDVGRGIAREHAKSSLDSGQTFEQQSIIIGNARYRSATEDQPSSRIEAVGCHGVSAALSSVLGCPGPTEESVKTVEAGRHEGKDAVVIVTTGTSYGSDETFTFTNKLYLDGETFLPVAGEDEGTMDYGEVISTNAVARYSTDFVPAESLPDDFFNPASIGYVERNPEDGLEAADPGITVYWLGRDFEGTDGLPPLTLAIAYVQPRERPAYRASLEYKLAEEEFGTPAVALEEWDRGEWDAWLGGSRGGNWWDWPCREKKEVTVDGRRVVIHMGFEDETMGRPDTLPEGLEDVVCPDMPYDRFITQIYLDDTVVQMEGRDVCASAGCEDSPYDTLEGIETVARALQPRP